MSSSRAFAAACVAVSCITNRTCEREGGVGGNQNVGWSAGGPPPGAVARRKRNDSAHGFSRLAEMQHRARLPVGVALRVAAATEGNPRRSPSTYPEPFREPRPRGLDQILRVLARGELGGRHRVARRCTRKEDIITTRRANLVARRRPPVPPRAIDVCAANSSRVCLRGRARPRVPLARGTSGRWAHAGAVTTRCRRADERRESVALEFERG